VGEVTKFLKEYGSMENLLLTDKLKGKMKENIEANKGDFIKRHSILWIVSMKLIMVNSPISRNRCPFNELEFRRMA
jgi:hypothetical protein